MHATTALYSQVHIRTVEGLCGETVITMATEESPQFRLSLCTDGGLINSCILEATRLHTTFGSDQLRMFLRLE